MLSFMDKATYAGQVQRAYEALSDATQALAEEEQRIQQGGSDSEQRSKAVIYGLITACRGLQYRFDNLARRLLLQQHHAKNRGAH